MADQAYAVGHRRTSRGPQRNWSLIIGRCLLVWGLAEAAMSGLVDLSGRPLLGVGAEHFAVDGIIAALAGIGFVIDGAARRLARATEAEAAASPLGPPRAPA